MTDFIEVYDNALSPALCQPLIRAFEKSPHQKPELTVIGTDPNRNFVSLFIW